jgi:hypothetical protein
LQEDVEGRKEVKEEEAGRKNSQRCKKMLQAGMK